MQIKLFSGMGLARLVANPCTVSSVCAASRSSTAGKSGAPLFGITHLSNYTKNWQHPKSWSDMVMYGSD